MENILLKSPESVVDIVIADYGLATFEKDNKSEILFTRCGTPGVFSHIIIQNFTLLNTSFIY